MSTGYTAQHDDMVRSLAYVSFQELATRVSHRNTGKITGDAVGDQLLARVAADENLHMVFYRNLLGAALELDPNQTMRAITDVVTHVRDARHRHRRLPAQGRRDGDRRRLRHPPAPRRRGRAGAAVLERLRARGPRRRGRGRPAPSSPTSWRSWRSRRSASRTSATRSRPGWRPARPARPPSSRRERTAEPRRVGANAGHGSCPGMEGPATARASAAYHEGHGRRAGPLRRVPSAGRGGSTWCVPGGCLRRSVLSAAVGVLVAAAALVAPVSTADTSPDAGTPATVSNDAPPHLAGQRGRLEPGDGPEHRLRDREAPPRPVRRVSPRAAGARSPPATSSPTTSGPARG